jgi:His/Glu/Gln/Arg/opine family amino acid ABC transporter permease subunit
MRIDFTLIQAWIPYLLRGTYITLQIAGIAAIGGSILGLLFGFAGRRKDPLGMAVRVVVDFFRGTPLVFQLTFFHLGLPQITGWVPTIMTSAGIVFTLNSACYLSEILRAGIESIDKGQSEAAIALGVRKLDIAIHIIIPQAIRNVLPAIMNEFITLIKETSVVSMIGATDLMRRQSIISGTTYRFFEPLLIVGITYYVLVKVLTIIGKRIERKLRYD